MSKKLTTEQIQALAAAYAWAISDAVTTEEWNEIVRLNKENPDSAYDATHDVVDGNHYICAAYEELFGEEPSLDEENMLDLADAVDYALDHFFIYRKDFILYRP
jgi:hypothetical protein